MARAISHRMSWLFDNELYCNVMETCCFYVQMEFMCVSFVKLISTTSPCCKSLWFPCQPQLAITQLPHSTGTMTSGLCTLQLCMCGYVCVVERFLRYRDRYTWVWPSFIGAVVYKQYAATHGLIVSLNLSFCLSLSHPMLVCCLAILICMFTWYG